MLKIQPSFHQGLEYVQLSRMPLSQAESLVEWLPATGIFCINIGGHKLRDCVSYEDYEFWFENDVELDIEVGYSHF
jgi:hypothetical protein